MAGRSTSTTRPRAGSAASSRSVTRRSAVVAELKRRRGGGPELLAYRNGRRWHDVSSTDINDYIKQATRGEFSAKDFRTWNATVLAAVALADEGAEATTKTARKRVMNDGGQGRRILPRQHAGRMPRLLHRPAGVRPLPVGLDDRRRAAGCGRPVPHSPPVGTPRGGGSGARPDHREAHARDRPHRFGEGPLTISDPAQIPVAPTSSACVKLPPAAGPAGSGRTPLRPSSARDRRMGGS